MGIKNRERQWGKMGQKREKGGKKGRNVSPIMILDLEDKRKRM